MVQRVSFGAGYPADVHADIPADVRGQKLRSGPRNPGKQAFRCGRPWPEGADVQLPWAVQKNFGQKNFGLNFCSLKSEMPAVPQSEVLAKILQERGETYGKILEIFSHRFQSYNFQRKFRNAEGSQISMGNRVANAIAIVRGRPRVSSVPRTLEIDP